MTDAELMDAPCVHGEVWHECQLCGAATAIDLAVLNGLDPFPIMAQELRKRGYTVTPPEELPP